MILTLLLFHSTQDNSSIHSTVDDDGSRSGDVVLDNGRLVRRGCGHRRLGMQRQLDQRDVVAGLEAIVRIGGRAARIAVTFLLLFRRQPRVRDLQKEEILVHVVTDHVVVNFRCNSVMSEKGRKVGLVKVAEINLYFSFCSWVHG